MLGKQSIWEGFDLASSRRNVKQFCSGTRVWAPPQDVKQIAWKTKQWLLVRTQEVQVRKCSFPDSAKKPKYCLILRLWDFAGIQDLPSRRWTQKAWYMFGKQSTLWKLSSNRPECQAIGKAERAMWFFIRIAWHPGSVSSNFQLLDMEFVSINFAWHCQAIPNRLLSNMQPMSSNIAWHLTIA